MRHTVIVPFILFCAIVIGGLVYIFGGPNFGEPASESPTEEGSFIVLAEGNAAQTIERRTNYRIKNEEELISLWQILYGTSASAPVVNFEKNEVIAILDGSHATNGYRVEVTDVIDAPRLRTIYIEHTEPGDACDIQGGETSPFQIIQLPRSFLPLSKQEITVQNCI